MQTITVPLDMLVPDPDNPRAHPVENIDAIARSLDRFGQVSPIVVHEPTSVVIGGNGTLEAARRLGWDSLEVVAYGGTKGEARALSVALNRTAELAQWDGEALGRAVAELKAEGFEAMDSLGFGSADLDALLSGGMAGLDAGPGPTTGEDWTKDYTEPPARMVDTFGAPPFSVLDARQGYWKARKDQWKALGLFTDEGRPEGAVGPRFGTSIVDPVVGELLYAWFCPPGGQVVNPTAGESVYGIVAGAMGYEYCGVELRQEQIDVNERHAQQMAPSLKVTPEWVQGDGAQVAGLGQVADFVICCPPYYDLEEYSNLPEDLSRAPTYGDFLDAYRAIVAGCAGVLKPDRFAAFVVGDIRDKAGAYRNFVGDTVTAFLDAGMVLHNEAILVDPAGTLPFRAGKAFRTSRKLGKTHQNVLVFLKGDLRAAVAACGDVTRVLLPDEEGA